MWNREFTVVVAPKKGTKASDQWRSGAVISQLSWWTPWAITRTLDVEGYIVSRSMRHSAFVLDSSVLRLRFLVL